MSPSDRSHNRNRTGFGQRIRDRISRLSPRQRVASGASAGVVILLVLVLIATLVFGASATPRKHHPKHPGTTTTSTLPHPKLARHLCPLTGQRARKGKVPRRPAIGIKIGNDPAARPQTGLLDADIVYEEMAEGGITRYLAVFQCHDAPVLGPVRSVRWDDWHVLASYGHPILAYSGGITAWEQIAAGIKWLYNADGSFYPMANVYYRTSDRSPPENYYTSTKALWALDPSNHTPPQPQFRYRPRPSTAAQPASGVTIVGYSEGQNVSWTWNAKAKAWERYQGGQADDDSSGTQLHATNVVIQIVRIYPEPYAESGSVLGVESFTKGTGVAYVLRNGKVEKGIWTTPAYGDVMQLHFANGNIMALDPGNTWVEEVPMKTYPVNIQS